MKSLYVNTKDQTFLTTDGTHLIIADPNTKIRSLLISELDTVLVRGRVIIDSQAVFFLARHNVAISLMEKDGHQDALFLPYNHCLAFHYREQRIILKSAENMMRYIKWLNTQKMLQQMAVIRRFSPQIKLKNEIGEGDYQCWLKEMRPLSLQLWMVVKNQIEILLRNFLANKILKAGLDIHLGGYFRRANYGFLLDMMFIMEVRADEDSLLFFKQKNWKELVEEESSNNFILLEEGFHNIVHRFENKKAKLSDIVDLIIDDFFALLRELRS
ncbi:MAG: CRISPR-associated endonuclease Cas1 [Candidatus Saccharicenans sp.]|nr:CRISPR-associated endonuclease Cas1 [Candidatus Saccharicenans sp.]